VCRNNHSTTEILSADFPLFGNSVYTKMRNQSVLSVKKLAFGNGM